MTTRPATVGRAQATGREPLWTRQFVLLLASAVFMYTSTFMLTPTLPVYAADLHAGSTSLGGIIVAAYTLGSLLPRVLWGRLADVWSRRGVYLLGVAVIGLVSPVFALVTAVAAIVAVRLVQGVGFSASSTAASTMAADLVPATRRAEGIGYYALANTLGMAAGPNLGLYLLTDHGADALFGASVVSGAIAVGTGLFLRYERRGSAAPTHRVVPAPRPSAESDRPRGLSRVLERSVLRTCVVFLFVVIPYGAIMAYVAAYGIEEGVGSIGTFFTVFAAALLVVRLGVGRISDRYGVTVTFVPGVLAMVAGLLVLWWADSLAHFLVCAALFGLGYGVVVPLLQSVAYGFAPSERRGAASATLFATADVAYGVGALVVGAAISVVGYRAAFTGLAGFAVVGSVLFFSLLRPTLRRSR